MQTSKPKKWRKYTLIGLLVIIFFGPIMGAYLLHYSRPAWLSHTTNKGQLITPPIDWNHLPLTIAPGAQLANHWLMVYVTRLPCQEYCVQHLFYVRQTYRTFLKKDTDRLQPVVLTFIGENDVDFSALLAKEYSNFVRVQMTPENFFTQFAATDVHAQNFSDALYVVDPNGNVMMSYGANWSPKALQKDLQKLLKASKIG